MKKLLTYFLIVTYLFSFSEVRQTLKLPNLVEHYIFHTLQDKNTTFFTFFKMHYLDAPIKDADYNQDMKLPFKTHDFSINSITITTPPKSFELVFEFKKISKENSRNFGYIEGSTSQFLSSVFRPPILG